MIPTWLSFSCPSSGDLCTAPSVMTFTSTTSYVQMTASISPETNTMLSMRFRTRYSKITLIARFMGPTWGPSGAMNFAIWAAISNRDPGALSLSQFTTNHFRIGHAWISSTGTRSSDELQRLDYMTGYQESVRQMTYPVSLSSCERMSKANLVGGADGSGPSYDRWIRGNFACISL